ncbi:hypothetical protein [Flexibacterium corallicola]|uniref:hypothetical protein n=1 Tax=Flexibacterium corallicola TaxID=3037259 RepID=UPI00286F01E4|nr:hypothetical protein [Pseudovibrio sp. M1P-2-3]
MSTINTSILQNQAAVLLQSLYVNQIQNTLLVEGGSQSVADKTLEIISGQDLDTKKSEEEKPKTAVEKIQDLVSAKADKTVNDAKARITDVLLQAKQDAELEEVPEVEENAPEEPELEFEFDGVLYDSIGGMSEEVRLAFIRETQAAFSDVEQQLASLTGFELKEPQKGNYTIGGINIANWELPAHVTEHYWGARSSGSSLAGELSRLDDDYDRLIEYSVAIGNYYDNEYGAGSVEALTLSNRFFDDREHILVERDSILDSHGYDSQEYIMFISNLMKEAPTSSGVHELPDGSILSFRGNSLMSYTMQVGTESIYYTLENEGGELALVGNMDDLETDSETAKYIAEKEQKMFTALSAAYKNEAFILLERTEVLGIDNLEVDKSSYELRYG